METYTNTSGETRVWPKIKHNGATLRLSPGEAVELELPENFEDPCLKLKPKAKKIDPPVESKAATTTTEEPQS